MLVKRQSHVSFPFFSSFFSLYWPENPAASKRLKHWVKHFDGVDSWVTKPETGKALTFSKSQRDGEDRLIQRGSTGVNAGPPKQCPEGLWRPAPGFQNSACEGSPEAFCSRFSEFGVGSSQSQRHPQVPHAAGILCLQYMKLLDETSFFFFFFQTAISGQWPLRFSCTSFSFPLKSKSTGHVYFLPWAEGVKYCLSCSFATVWAVTVLCCSRARSGNGHTVCSEIQALRWSHTLQWQCKISAILISHPSCLYSDPNPATDFLLDSRQGFGSTS